MSRKLPQNIRHLNNLLVFEWECNTLPSGFQQRLFLGNIQTPASEWNSFMFAVQIHLCGNQVFLSIDCLIQGLTLTWHSNTCSPCAPSSGGFLGAGQALEHPLGSCTSGGGWLLPRGPPGALQPSESKVPILSLLTSFLLPTMRLPLQERE